MLRNYDSDWNIDDLTDTEIYAAIRYLEPNPGNANEQDTDEDTNDNGVVIGVCLYIALSVCIALFWFYWR